jgi:hypothetical protein
LTSWRHRGCRQNFVSRKQGATRESRISGDPAAGLTVFRQIGPAFSGFL